MKELLAKAIANRVKNGEIIGFGSGSTTEIAITEIGKRIAAEGLQVFAIPTSCRTAILASEVGVYVLEAAASVTIAWAFDGADEVDPEFNMIKGRGGAMLSEKIIAKRAKELVIVVTKDKLVQKLGTHHAVPVEVIPEALPLAVDGLRSLGAKDVGLRPAVNKYGPEMSEHNNLILDAHFEKITAALEQQIKSLTGVVESGLFFGFNQELLVAEGNAVISRRIKDGRIVEIELPLPLL